MRSLLITARLVALLAAGGLAAAVPAEAARPPAPTLKAFRTCSSLVDEAQDAAQEPPIPFRGPQNWSGSDVITPRAPFDQPDPNARLSPEPLPAVAVTEESASAADTTITSSTTNVQEAGIDEPDLVKAIGGRLYVVAGSTLWAFDASGEAPRTLGTLDLGRTGGTLLIEGSKALVLLPRKPVAPAFVADVEVSGGPQPSRTATTSRLVEVDLSDPAAMRILRSMDVPGELVTARLTEGAARVVVNSNAALDGAPAGTSTTPLPAEGLRRRAASRLRLRAFVPRTTLRSRVTGRQYRRSLVRCGEVRRPEDPAGTNLLTILTVDLRQGLFNVDRDAILGSAQTVYASPTSLVVASSAYAGVTRAGRVPANVTTQLYRFDTTVRDQTSFASAGEVPGFVIGQYAISEHEGALRVATTTEPDWTSGGAAADRENILTVLREREGRLTQIGQLTGLGRGELIYAARYVGPTAYLVTFRQTDPLYTLDLSDPARPRVAGELKITGYSAYLHPVGAGLLLGIGQEATAQGRRTGAATSLFDVAEPATPKLLARLAFEAGSLSTVDSDPHAFLWWAPAQLALIPTTAIADWPASATGSAGSLTGLRVDRAGITPVGRAEHGPDWDHPMLKRSVVVGARVLTLSDLGIQSASLTGLQPQGWQPWPVPAPTGGS